jgi:hypothetical protein
MVFRPVNKSTITLYKRGAIYFPAAVYARYFAGHPLVRLEYMPKTRSIRITPTSQSGGDVYALRNQTRGTKGLKLRLLFKRHRIRLTRNVFADLKYRDGRLMFQIPEDAIEERTAE